MKQQTYYMTIDKQNIIWGVGNSKEESKKDAKKSLKNWIFDNGMDDGTRLSKSIPCSKFLYEYVKKHGAGEDDTWQVIDGIAKLDKERQNELYEKGINNFAYLSKQEFEKIDSIHGKLNIIFHMLKCLLKC